MKLTRRAFLAASTAVVTTLALPSLGKADYALTLSEIPSHSYGDSYLIPSGTRMMFMQENAPQGWTRIQGGPRPIVAQKD